ncbi:hypothetical protein Bbelb_220940 [Branchiostoma belcheri]|nr:hypothetical protein Bbelb_220940 [Branchiostoma belcheri]
MVTGEVGRPAGGRTVSHRPLDRHTSKHVCDLLPDWSKSPAVCQLWDVIGRLADLPSQPCAIGMKGNDPIASSALFRDDHLQPPEDVGCRSRVGGLSYFRRHALQVCVVRRICLEISVLGLSQGQRSAACQDSNSGPLGSESSTLSLRHTSVVTPYKPVPSVTCRARSRAVNKPAPSPVPASPARFDRQAGARPVLMPT